MCGGRQGRSGFLAAAPAVARGVARNRQQPRGELLRLAQAGAVAVDLEEGLLRQVLGLGAVPGELVELRVDQPGVLAHDHGKGLRVVAQRARDGLAQLRVHGGFPHQSCGCRAAVKLPGAAWIVNCRR